MDIETLLELLKGARERRDTELRARWNRSLPFADAVFDRWERARSLGFGEGASIYDSAMVFGTVRVGAGTWVGPNVMLDGSGGTLDIGSTCSISAGVQIYTHDTVLWAVSGGILPRREGAVSVGDCVYVGSQSIIAPGVVIGARCVVAANSFINRSIPEGTIVGGTPAKAIGRVEGQGEEVRLVYGEAPR